MVTKLLIAIVFLSPLAFLSACTSHCGISHGTVVIASMDADSIILAADSRETDVFFSSKKVTFADTAHKIFHIGQTFFAIAGLSELCTTSTRKFVTDVYDTAKSIKENMPVVEARLRKALQSELDSYSIKQKRLLAGHDYSVVLDIAGYEKGIPTLCRIDAGVKFVNLFANPVQSSASISAGRKIFDIAGIYDHIYEVKINLDSNKLRTMRQLISLEARYHKDVDSLVQYVVIKKDGYRTGTVSGVQR
ncbi:MAG: hypothetical protein JST19_23365 [Bacteroidetes bacterium]|nr:hypothetical protein [Bacteroidota bacterium]